MKTVISMRLPKDEILAVKSKAAKRTMSDLIAEKLRGYIATGHIPLKETQEMAQTSLSLDVDLVTNLQKLTEEKHTSILAVIKAAMHEIAMDNSGHHATM